MIAALELFVQGSGTLLQTKKNVLGMGIEMLETIYETKPAETQRRQLPNNRRQIGAPEQGEPEVFIEDYAFSFAKELAERDYTGCVVGVLVGECVESIQKDKILVRGVLEAKEVMAHDKICFTEDNWSGIYRNIREYFPKEQIVGWFLGGPDFLLEDTARQKKIQQDNFGGGDKILLKADSVEKEQKVLFYKDGELTELPGYYIYYERNAEMQNYMAGSRAAGKKLLDDRNTRTGCKSETMLDNRNTRTGCKTGTAEDDRNLPNSYGTTTDTQQTNTESTSGADYVRIPQGSRQKPWGESTATGFYRLFYATGGVLTCIAILVIAGLALQIKERNELKALLNEQERLVSSMQQVYLVEEGETIRSICLKFYGSTEKEEAVRLLNSLPEGEEPAEGQKIFLP